MGTLDIPKKVLLQLARWGKGQVRTPTFSSMRCLATSICCGTPLMVNIRRLGSVLGGGFRCSSTCAPDCWLMLLMFSPPAGGRQKGEGGRSAVTALKELQPCCPEESRDPVGGTWPRARPAAATYAATRGRGGAPQKPGIGGLQLPGTAGPSVGWGHGAARPRLARWSDGWHRRRHCLQPTQAFETSARPRASPRCLRGGGDRQGTVQGGADSGLMETWLDSLKDP